MNRLRPIFLLIMIGIGIGGYFATTSSWQDLYELKGPAWFGEAIDARVINAATFTETSWDANQENPEYTHRDHVRVRYEFVVDGQKYVYPYENGYAEVSAEQAAQATVRVVYLPSDPANNHPATTDWKFGDQMAGFVIGIILSLIALLMAIVWLKGLIFGRKPQAEAA